MYALQGVLNLTHATVLVQALPKASVRELPPMALTLTLTLTQGERA